MTTSLLIPTSAGERFGSVLRERALADVRLRESAYGPGVRMPSHRHPHPYFCLVLRGRLLENVGGLDASFGPGTVHFHPVHEAHASETGPEGAHCLSITFEGRLEQVLTRSRCAVPYRALGGGVLRAVHACARELPRGDDASDLALEAASLSLVSNLLRLPNSTGGRAPEWLAALVQTLETAGPPAPRLSELAASAGVGEVQLVREFRRHLGCTPGAYLRRRRLESVRLGLETTRRPIAELAFEAGYSDQAHMTRAFRAAFSQTPAAYRRAHGRPAGGRSTGRI